MSYVDVFAIAARRYTVIAIAALGLSTLAPNRCARQSTRTASASAFRPLYLRLPHRERYIQRTTASVVCVRSARVQVCIALNECVVSRRRRHGNGDGRHIHEPFRHSHVCKRTDVYTYVVYAFTHLCLLLRADRSRRRRPAARVCTFSVTKCASFCVWPERKR